MPDYLSIRWRYWRKDLLNLEKFEVQKCLKPDSFGMAEKIELHRISDTCERGMVNVLMNE